MINREGVGGVTVVEPVAGGGDYHGVGCGGRGGRRVGVEEQEEEEEGGEGGVGGHMMWELDFVCGGAKFY